MNRQQRRATQRAQAKVKVVNPTAMGLSMAAALHPSLWQPKPAPAPAIAINCTPNQAQSIDSSNAAAGVAGAMVEAKATETTTTTIFDIAYAQAKAELAAAKILREALDKEHAEQDKSTGHIKMGLFVKGVEPLPEHPRHQSGFPCNPFTGKRTKPHAGAHSATHHVEIPSETEEAL